MPTNPFRGSEVGRAQDTSVKDSEGGKPLDLSRMLFDGKRKSTMTPEGTGAYDENYSKGAADSRKKLKREASDQEQWAKDPRDKVVLAKDNLKGGMDPMGSIPW